MNLSQTGNHPLSEARENNIYQEIASESQYKQQSNACPDTSQELSTITHEENVGIPNNKSMIDNRTESSMLVLPNVSSPGFSNESKDSDCSIYLDLTTTTTLPTTQSNQSNITQVEPLLHFPIQTAGPATIANRMNTHIYHDFQPNGSSSITENNNDSTPITTATTTQSSQLGCNESLAEEVTVASSVEHTPYQSSDELTELTEEKDIHACNVLLALGNSFPVIL